MPVLGHASYLQYQPISVGLKSISFPCTTTCFPKGIWFSKSQTAFLVHTKKERPRCWFHGPGLKPGIRSGGMGVSGWDREGGTPYSAYINLIPCYSRL